MAYVILIATVITSLTAWYIFPHFFEEGMLRPYYTIRQHKWYQLITSGFLHADFLHLFFNMFTFYIFGPYLEQILGTPVFTGMYFTALIVSSLPSVIKHKDDPSFASLGASGAVEAVIFSFILFYPWQPLYIMFIPIGIPALIFGILFLAYSIYESRRNRGIINHDAHIAGAVSGIVFTIAFRPQALQIFLHQIVR
ncbi:MAG TPA: rhomboid family intramembrane serine protease [Balneolales bacterium]|jgi:membrane associated rhomboid family serine protease|nr:rhomboid family intramembrane serine protease [Balneolales bacterium]